MSSLVHRLFWRGDNATFAAVGAGDPPLTYTWAQGATVLGSGPSLTLSNVTVASALSNLVCIVSNGFSRATSPPVALTVLVDNDRDGMADFWEVAFTFNTNSAADALLDSDSDGINNRENFRPAATPGAPTTSCGSPPFKLRPTPTS